MLLISARMHRLVLLVLCAAAATSATAPDAVDTYSFPAFDATTAATGDLVAVTNSSITGLSSLFGSASSSSDEQQHLSRVNRSEGFLLLSRKVNVWRAAGDEGDGAPPPVPVPGREASFNTSFSLSGSSPVAFVVLRDTYPPFLSPDGFRGPGNVTFAPDAAAYGGLAAVEAGAVRAYGPEDPAVGLNVTVTPHGVAPGRTVWVEYDAAAHRLSVYVAAAGMSRPPKAMLDATVALAAGRRTTRNASVGFFGGAVRHVILGVRGWNLTVERLDDAFPGGGAGRKKGTSSSWMVVILIAVLGWSAAAIF